MNTQLLNILELPDFTRLTSYVLTDSNLETQSKQVVKGVKEIFSADACIIRILKKDKLFVLASNGVKAENLLPILPSNKGLAQKMLSNDKPVKVFDVDADPITIKMINRNKNEFKFVSFAGAPLIADGKRFGVIGIYITKSKREFTNIELEKLKIVANLVAIRLENVRLYSALNQSAKKMKQEVKIRQEAENKLRVALQEAENSAKIKSEFFAQISHEIRTPVNTLLNFTGLIKEEYEQKVNNGMEENFDIISRAGKRLIRTIDLILDMTDLQAGTYDYYPQQINLKALLAETVDEFFFPAKKKNITLSAAYADADYSMSLDEYTVKQIL
ncbi:MAG: GAF domain-containing sensor histidine kinase [Ignavibacteriaceae bacterium]|nr:GAF domain-containing sensor histidine kinase [Ignavibacteriaceae bacterium]